MADRRFRICTLVTDWDQYARMKATFVAAGFDEGRCQYSPFDNAGGNRFDPYRTIDAAVADTAEPYLIVCHQDVRADAGYGFDDLASAIATVEAADAEWAVLGNAGCTDDFDFVLRVTDPNRFPLWAGPLPLPVHSLDENFLVLNVRVAPRCSAELCGFHLYGTDLCLNARLAGHSCYVIDFNLTHLSAGTFGPDFFRARDAFVRRWNRAFVFQYVIRGADVFLGRWRWARWLGSKHRLRLLLLRHRLLRPLMTLDLRVRQAAR